VGQASGEAPPAAIHDEYESGPELEEIVGPADPGPVDYAPRPEDQADLWEGLFGPEEEGAWDGAGVKWGLQHRLRW
jgi:hypothetical protein